MNVFIELRQQARDKRDKAIAQAREDYAATLRRIAGLEQDLAAIRKAVRGVLGLGDLA